MLTSRNMPRFILGLISDTHGLLRPEAQAALQGSHAIIHAGDVGNPKILSDLKSIAPVFAIRGNTDTEAWSAQLPVTEAVELHGISIYVLHNLNQLDLDPAASGFKIVVSGHTHNPDSHWSSDVLYINPGSAGPKRFSLPITIAQLDLLQTPWQVKFNEIVKG